MGFKNGNTHYCQHCHFFFLRSSRCIVIKKSETYIFLDFFLSIFQVRILMSYEHSQQKEKRGETLWDARFEIRTYEALK